MKHTSTAVLLAALVYAGWPSAASANHPKQCGPFCTNLFQKIHQHGPLFNYGPYYGYPPFEPYGPWNSYLQYNPWYYGDPNAGGRGGLFGGHGLGHGCRGCGHGQHACWASGGWFRGHGCLSCGHHGGKGGGFGCFGCGHHARKESVHGCKQCGHGGHGLFHHHGKGGCSSCAVVIDPATTDAVARYAGVGDPAASASYYTGLPSLDPTYVK